MQKEGAFHAGVQLKEEGHRRINARRRPREDMDNGESMFVRNYPMKEGKGVVDKKYVLVDNQSTVDQICNAVLLKNIRKMKNLIVVHCMEIATLLENIAISNACYLTR